MFLSLLLNTSFPIFFHTISKIFLQCFSVGLPLFLLLPTVVYQIILLLTLIAAMTFPSFVPFLLITSLPTCNTKCLLFGNSKLLFLALFSSAALTSFEYLCRSLNLAHFFLLLTLSSFLHGWCFFFITNPFSSQIGKLSFQLLVKIKFAVFINTVSLS